MDDFLSDELKEMFSRLIDLYDIAYVDIKNKVNRVISNKIRDKYTIEHLFDEIINIPTDKRYELFIELCAYVSQFNKELVDDYIELYNDLYGDDDKEANMKI